MSRVRAHRAAAANGAEGRRGGFAWREDRWVRPFFRRYRRALLAALGLGLVAYAFAALLMFSSGFLISLSATPPDTFLDLLVPLAFVQVFGLGKPVVSYLERLSSHDWVLRMTSGLRLALYRALEVDALAAGASRRTGDVLGLLDEDIGHLQNLYLRTVFPTVVAWVLFAVLVVAFGCFSLPLAGALALLIAVEIGVMPLVSVLCCAARRRRAKELRNELYAELTDNVLGVSDWVYAGRTQECLTRHRDVQRAAEELDRADDAFARRRDLAMQLVFGLIVTLLVVWAGATLGAGGSWPVAANWIAAVALVFFPLIDAFAQTPSAAVDALSYEDSVARLNALPKVDVAEPQEADSPRDAAEPLAAAEDVPAEVREAPADSPVAGCEPSSGPSVEGAPAPSAPLDLRICNVSFAYPGEQRLVLNDLSLEVPQGQKLAVLGRSGAGKSTLLSLVRGDSSPLSGTVSIGGVPCDRLGDDASRIFGVIQQQTYLFDSRLIDNLRVGRADATVDEVWDAVARVGLLPLVERLPEGLGTRVGEGGTRFSGGERHRIALARVLLQGAPVVMLDEPCVGLDPITENDLLKTLFQTLSDRTVIMVTHHLAGVADMDRVVFIDQGRVALDGEPAQLERDSERYQRLLRLDRGIAAR